jgi:hypothetical protein
MRGSQLSSTSSVNLSKSFLFSVHCRDSCLSWYDAQLGQHYGRGDLRRGSKDLVRIIDSKGSIFSKRQKTDGQENPHANMLIYIYILLCLTLYIRKGFVDGYIAEFKDATYPAARLHVYEHGSRGGFDNSVFYILQPLQQGIGIYSLLRTHYIWWQIFPLTDSGTDKTSETSILWVLKVSSKSSISLPGSESSRHCSTCSANACVETMIRVHDN